MSLLSQCCDSITNGSCHHKEVDALGKARGRPAGLGGRAIACRCRPKKLWAGSRDLLHAQPFTCFFNNRRLFRIKSKSGIPPPGKLKYPAAGRGAYEGLVRSGTARGQMLRAGVSSRNQHAPALAGLHAAGGSVASAKMQQKYNRWLQMSLDQAAVRLIRLMNR